MKPRFSTDLQEKIMKSNFLRIKQHPIAGAVAAALALGGGLVASNGYAATETASLAVSASITNACTISTTPLAFGLYVSGPGNVAKDGTGTVTTTCTTGASNTVTLGQGANIAGGSTDAVPLRQMADGTNRLAYSLYQDAGRTTVWGNTTPTGVTGTGTGSAVQLTVFGQIPAGQSKPAGTYADTVVATVTF